MTLLKSGCLGGMDVWLGVNGPPSQSQLMRISTEFICSHPLYKVKPLLMLGSLSTITTFIPAVNPTEG